MDGVNSQSWPLRVGSFSEGFGCGRWWWVGIYEHASGSVPGRVTTHGRLRTGLDREGRAATGIPSSASPTPAVVSASDGGGNSGGKFAAGRSGIANNAGICGAVDGTARARAGEAGAAAAEGGRWGDGGGGFIVAGAGYGGEEATTKEIIDERQAYESGRKGTKGQNSGSVRGQDFSAYKRIGPQDGRRDDRVASSSSRAGRYSGHWDWHNARLCHGKQWTSTQWAGLFAHSALWLVRWVALVGPAASY